MKKFLIILEPLFLTALLFTFAWLAISLSSIRSNAHFTELAWSFAHGHTYFLHEINVQDTVLHNGHRFWPQPPFPAVLLIPSTLILNEVMSQMGVSIIINILVFISIYRLAHLRFGISKINAVWLSIMYIFASVYAIATYIPWSYYYAHALATLLLMASFLEYFGKKRYWIIGILMGLVWMTRFPAGLISLFFVIMIFIQNGWKKSTFVELLKLSIPIAVAGALLMGYNFIRFGIALNPGYSNITHEFLRILIDSYGLFDIRYVPSNIYHYFIESFQPILAQFSPNYQSFLLTYPYLGINEMSGPSFFITSPLFILVFFAERKKDYIIPALAVSGSILLLLLAYFYPGAPQIGPRYMNDLLPLIFIVLLSYFQQHQLNLRHKIIITASCLVNLYIAHLL